jgi:hypothetical protein
MKFAFGSRLPNIDYSSFDRKMGALPWNVMLKSIMKHLGVLDSNELIEQTRGSK